MTTTTPPSPGLVQPGPDPSTENGAVLLDQVRATIRRYAILPDENAMTAVVLWIAATHAVPAWAHATRMVVRAPEKRCGKSRLLNLVEGMSHNPLMTVNASTAAVVRYIAKTQSNPPTILLDEADTVFGPKAAGDNEDLRGLLNAGFERGRPAIRWDVNRDDVVELPTFAMAALAGIGAMPDTIEDRAIVIRMRRRAAGETVAPFRKRRDGEQLDHLRVRLAAWMRANMRDLSAAVPVLPVEDRAADAWEPLVAVADLAGGQWPDLARTAAVALTEDREANARQSLQARLLADCRTAFANSESLKSTTLLDLLKSDSEAPWATYGGTGLNPSRLADLLREFDINSRTIRFGELQAKGYRRADFVDAWDRYCTPPTATPAQVEPYQPSHPSQPGDIAGHSPETLSDGW